jgi:hypothetical protein
VFDIARDARLDQMPSGRTTRPMCAPSSISSISIWFPREAVTLLPGHLIRVTLLVPVTKWRKKINRPSSNALRSAVLSVFFMNFILVDLKETGYIDVISVAFVHV